jgi:hypothetical protein
LITRRRFLERTGILPAGISVSKLPSPQPQLTTLDPDKLSPYVDPLPIPQIAQAQRNADTSCVCRAVSRHTSPTIQRESSPGVLSRG